MASYRDRLESEKIQLIPDFQGLVRSLHFA